MTARKKARRRWWYWSRDLRRWYRCYHSSRDAASLERSAPHVLAVRKPSRPPKEAAR